MVMSIDTVLQMMQDEFVRGMVGLHICENETDLQKWKQTYLGKDSLFNIVLRELFRENYAKAEES